MCNEVEALRILSIIRKGFIEVLNALPRILHARPHFILTITLLIMHLLQVFELLLCMHVYVYTCAT